MNGRVAPRRPAARCPWITGVRIEPDGGAAELMDISWSGARVRFSKRVRPGAGVTLVFEGSLKPSVVHSRVARCEVGGVGRNGLVQYYLGVVFNEPLSLPDEDLAPVQAAARVADSSVENRW